MKAEWHYGWQWPLKLGYAKIYYDGWHHVLYLGFFAIERYA